MRKQVIQWIVRHITEEGLRSGDRLPSEHKIATFTKAGRSSVREALQWLAGQGIIEAHAGKGYYLRILERAPIHPSLPTVGIEEIRDLTEARLVIECACAAIAARRATPAEIERIDAFLDGMAAKVATASSIYPETIQFHLMIAQAAHNRTLFSMMQVMVVPWLVAYNARLASDVPDRAHREFAIHRDLWAQIRTGDPEAARAAMETHIRDAASVYLLAYEPPVAAARKRAGGGGGGGGTARRR